MLVQTDPHTNKISRSCNKTPQTGHKDSIENTLPQTEPRTLFAFSALKFMLHTYRFTVCFECFTGPINKPDVKTNGN